MRSSPNRGLTSAVSLCRGAEQVFWYILLTMVALLTIFPFVWVFFTSMKGPLDPIYTVPPQLIPHDFTFAN